MSLRLRHEERGELEAHVEGDEPEFDAIPDKKVRRAVVKATGDAALRPVFETIVERTTRKLDVHGSEVELAFAMAQSGPGRGAGGSGRSSWSSRPAVRKRSFSRPRRFQP
jgi:hypothetical protein